MEKVERKKVVLRQCPICGGQVDPRTLTDEMVMMPAEMLASLQSRAERAEKELIRFREEAGASALKTIKLAADISAAANRIEATAKTMAKDTIAAVRRAERAEAMVERLIEAGNLCAYATSKSGWPDEYSTEWHTLVAEWEASKDGGAEK